MGLTLVSLLCFLLPFLSQCERPLGTKIKYSNCGPDNIISVDIVPCPSQPCAFDRGTNATVTIQFKTQTQATKVTTKVYGIVGGVPIPYDTPPDACTGCNLNCPLAAGGNYTYINSFPVLKEYPPIKLTVKWTLVDDAGDDMICFLFPMQIN